MAVESKNILEFYKSFSVMRSCDGAKKGDFFFFCVHFRVRGELSEKFC